MHYDFSQYLHPVIYFLNRYHILLWANSLLKEAERQMRTAAGSRDITEVFSIAWHLQYKQDYAPPCLSLTLYFSATFTQKSRCVQFYQTMNHGIKQWEIWRQRYLCMYLKWLFPLTNSIHSDSDWKRQTCSCLPKQVFASMATAV